MKIALYDQSELVGICSINADGSFAFEGTPEGAALAAGISPATTPPADRLQRIADYDNYPYSWAEPYGDDGRTLLGKAIDLLGANRA